jgi:hypothetical protein
MTAIAERHFRADPEGKRKFVLHDWPPRAGAQQDHDRPPDHLHHAVAEELSQESRSRGLRDQRPPPRAAPNGTTTTLSYRPKQKYVGQQPTSHLRPPAAQVRTGRRQAPQIQPTMRVREHAAQRTRRNTTSRGLLADDQALGPRQVPHAAQLDATKVTVMVEKYYPREQPDNLQPRERGLGAGAVHQTESEWSELIAMLELAQYWQELMGEFTGEDAHPWLAASAWTWPASRAAAAST